MGLTKTFDKIGNIVVKKIACEKNPVKDGNKAKVIK